MNTPNGIDLVYRRQSKKVGGSVMLLMTELMEPDKWWKITKYIDGRIEIVADDRKPHILEILRQSDEQGEEMTKEKRKELINSNGI